MSTKNLSNKEEAKNKTADQISIAKGLEQLDAQVAALLEARATNKDSKNTSPSSAKLADNKK